MMTACFQEILQHWNSAKNAAEQRLILSDLLKGDWLEACQIAVSAGAIEEIDTWLRKDDMAIKSLFSEAADRNPFYSYQMDAYLFTARAALLMEPEQIQSLLGLASATTQLTLA